MGRGRRSPLRWAAVALLLSALVDAASESDACTAAAGACPAPGQQPGQDVKADYDAIVVGGGISGLIAARDLLRAGKRVLVLEARPVLGGRSQRRPMTYANGTAVPCGAPQCGRGKVDSKWWWDRGGMWLGRTHERFIALQKEYGVETYDAAQVLGKLKLYINGQAVVVSPAVLEGADVPAADLRQLSPAQAASLAEFNRLVGLLMEVVAATNLEAPWDTPDARRLDSMTFSTWLDQSSNDSFAKDMLTWLYPLNHGLAGGLEPGWVSLLGVARFLKSGPLEDSEKWMFYGAAGQFVEHLSDEVRRRGGAVQVGAPVRHIKQDASGVTVYSDLGVYTARYAILAMPPHLAGRVTYEPAPPPARTQLMQRSPMGSTVKLVAVYDSPWWRKGAADGGLPASVTTIIDTDPETAVTMIFDVSPPDGPGVLASFLFGRHALELPAQGAEAVERAALAAFVRLLGDERAARPLSFQYVDLAADQWIGGAYAAYLPPGGLTHVGPAMYQPMGRIHWAGTENSPRWPGYYEGAIQAGEAAARAVAALLKQA